MPTPNFFCVYDLIPDEIGLNLARFGQLHYSDWYLNRAIWRMCLGVCWLHDRTNQIGETRSRDAQYYATASLKFLATWRKIVSKENIQSLEQRGLAPAVPSADQIVMLAVRSATSVDDLLHLMRQMLPFHSANFAALSAQNKLTAYESAPRHEAEELLAAIRADKRVSPAVLAIIETNFERMKAVVWGNVPRFVLPPEYTQ
jgi:hypothetical protein